MGSRTQARIGAKTKPANLQGHRKNILTDKQILFAETYVNNNCNGRSAAIAAGVPERNASSMSCQWLDSERYPAVQAYIEQLFEKRRNIQEVKGEHIIRELARIAFFSQKRLLDRNGVPIPLKDLPEDVAAAISEIRVSYREDIDGDGNFHTVKSVNIKVHDKLSALSQLTKMMGLDNGNALTILNQTNINNILINWNDLYRPVEEEAKAIKARELQDDDIEARIANEARSLPSSSPLHEEVLRNPEPEVLHPQSKPELLSGPNQRR